MHEISKHASCRLIANETLEPKHPSPQNTFEEQYLTKRNVPSRIALELYIDKEMTNERIRGSVILGNVTVDAKVYSHHSLCVALCI